MKVFLDTASADELQWALTTGLIDGITTNPALLAHEAGDEGAGSRSQLAELARLVSGPVCAEVLAVDADAMYRDGRELAKVADNIVVQIPMIEEGILAVRRLCAEGIRVDTTLIFNAAQALFAAKAGAAYVSPFIGRLEDIGANGIEMIREIRTIFDNYGYECEILAASIRSPAHFMAAARLGADGATVPAAVLRSLLLHPLTDVGFDQFLNDWSHRIARSRAEA
ncbi:MAG: fructose-6-phosphate aldolase [Gemmatimonadaceae bacterium]